MQVQSKYKIEFNKDLSAKHSITTRNGKEIKYEKIFEEVNCFLNFDEDLLEFEFKYGDKHRVSVQKKAILFEKTSSFPIRKSSNELKIVSDESKEETKTESNFTIVEVKANIKDVLLSLFSGDRKEFKLKIDYLVESTNYQTVYFVAIPLINQKDWGAGASRIPGYEAHEVGGSDLVRLFRNYFKLKINSEPSESNSLQQLEKYASATTVDKFNKLNFLEMFRRMMVIRDLTSIKEMEDFSLTFQQVFYFRSCRYTLRNYIEERLIQKMCPRKMKTCLENSFFIEVNKKMPNDASEFDYIYLTDMADYQNFHDDLHSIADQRIIGKIADIFDNVILFHLTSKSQRSARQRRGPFIDEERHYHVEFQPNRVTVRVAHQAIDIAESKQMSTYFKDFTGQEKPFKESFQKIKWMNPMIYDNKEQQVAIKNIVNCSSYPSPYILFGPPGTGKTSTIIEAIAQIVKLNRNAQILVTASSNAACDEVGKRLLKYVSINKILRLYSSSFDNKPEKIEKELQPISNFRNRRMCSCKKRSCAEMAPCDDPTYEEFYTARVIIATLVTCGRFFTAGVKSNHFDYIFIDEAASECEPLTLIPIVFLGTAARGINAQVVLSGDHMQLGPIVQEPFCRKLGMEKSMMERIMETNRNYQRQGDYDSKFVTQLVRNYRSHQAILQFSSDNFYDSKLEFKCPKKVANFACGWKWLRNKDFPLLFHSTSTPCKGVGLSLMNEGEVNVLRQYVNAIMVLGIKGHKISQDDIGIISPYRAQRDRIQEHLSHSYDKIEVGTVDSFQGREKKIIILSTVRSQTRHVGFLRNEKRLNVALTRAKSLLICIGNTKTLQKSQIWNKFIDYCHNNNAIVGDVLSVDEDILDDPNYQGDEEKPEEIEDEYDE